MAGVLLGFTVVASVIAVGFLAGRLKLAGEHAVFVLSRIAFFVLSPCLLFTVLASADITVLFSSVLVVSGISAVAAALIFVLIARLVWRRSIGDVTIGALGSGYVNANNIGIPLAAYVLGDAAFSAPVMVLQLLLFAPIALTMLDIQERGRVSVGRVLLAPFVNPIIIGSVLGILVSLTGFEVPVFIDDPIRLIGGAAIPVILLSFGISLSTQRPLSAGTNRKDVVLATSIKLIAMPLIAWLLGAFVFHLDPHLLLGVVVLAALPTAQNVFAYAQRYDHGVTVARDVVLLTTVGCIPVLVLVAVLLAE